MSPSKMNLRASRGRVCGSKSDRHRPVSGECAAQVDLRADLDDERSNLDSAQVPDHPDGGVLARCEGRA